MAIATVPENLIEEEEDEQLQEVAERLCERFPSISAERVSQILRDHNGHAGYAAAKLRALSVDVIKSADPDDSEHVATLLSNHLVFKQTCRAHFKKFDLNQNGVLDWDEVLALTNHLCSYMGLEHPSEKSLQAFFESSDANHDGVLTEREFPKFFESFLRYAFFMQHRRLAGLWKYKPDAEDRSRAEFEILLGRDYRLYYRSTRGSCPGAPKSWALPSGHEVYGMLELRDGCLQANLKAGERDTEKRGHFIHERLFGVVRIRFAEGTSEKVVANFKTDIQADWSSDVTAKRRRTVEEERVSRSSSPTVGTLLCCTAPTGITYRRSPELSETTDATLAYGATVRVMERHLDTHWVRAAGGWLPTVNQDGVKLFELEFE